MLFCLGGSPLISLNILWLFCIVFIHRSLHFTLGVWFLMFLKILPTSELITFQINFKHFHYYQILSINFCGWNTKIQSIVLTINIQKYSCILTLFPGTLVNSFNSNNLPVDSTDLSYKQVMLSMDKFYFFLFNPCNCHVSCL